ncbi:hypothetical protein CBS101457_002788 [Exobasidium rhododendri]|nr:hypothetical protein CBS101457_002788 [Exobasidium rhododendri]
MLVVHPFAAVLLFVGTFAAIARSDADNDRPISISFYKNSECLSLDEFPPVDYVVLECQPTLTNVAKSLKIGDVAGFQSQCVAGEFKSMMIDNFSNKSKVVDSVTDGPLLKHTQKTYKMTENIGHGCVDLSIKDGSERADSRHLSAPANEISAFQCIYRDE